MTIPSQEWLRRLIFTQRKIKPAELTLFSRPSYPKPVFGLNCDPKCILLRATIYCCDKRRRGAPKFASNHSPVRVLGNFGNPSGVVSLQDLRAWAAGRRHGRIRR